MNLPKLFNENRKHVVMTSTTKVLDESMSTFRSQSTAKGNLPHLSHISRKPEDLGTEFKTAACAELKMMLAMDLCRSRTDQQGKEFIQHYKNKKPLHAVFVFFTRLIREREPLLPSRIVRTFKAQPTEQPFQET